MTERRRRALSPLERLHAELVGAVLLADRVSLPKLADALDRASRRVLARLDRRRNR